MDKRSTYIFSADVIRDIAIFGVIIIHTANGIFARPDYLGGIAWWIALILNSISRASIPLFIILSGYLLLRKNENFSKSLKRTLLRIFIPFLFWLAVYMAWTGTQFSLSRIDYSYITRIFSANVYDLYFLVIMIGLYIAAPFLRSYLHNVSAQNQRYLMIALLVLGLIEVAGEYLFQRCSSETLFTMWIPYTGLFVAGYVLGDMKKVKTLRFSALYLLGLGVTIALGYTHFFLLSQGQSFLDSPGCLTFYSDYYLSPNVMLMALTGFVLLLNFSYTWIQSTFIRPLLTSIARASFAIYLIHILFIQLEEATNFSLTLGGGSVMLLSSFIFKLVTVSVISYIASFILIKIPIVKWVFGETR